MTNKSKDEAVDASIKIDSDSKQNEINELKAQVALLTQMINSQAQRNVEAENRFFKEKFTTFKITTFNEPNKAPDVKEVTVYNGTKS